MTEWEIRTKLAEATIDAARKLCFEACPHCKVNGNLHPVPQFEPSDNPHVLRFDWTGYLSLIHI